MADAPKILGTDSLRQAYPKLNSAIDNSNDAVAKADRANGKADNAVTTAKDAKTKAESVQAQFDQVVIEGDSSVEAAQARVDSSGNVFSTLKDRLDDQDGQLEESEKKRYKLDDDTFYKALTFTRDKKPLFSIVDDDGHKDVWSVMKPVAEAENVPMNLAVIPSRVEANTENFLTLSQLYALQKSGFEIVSHTYNHVNLDTVGPEVQKQEMYDSKVWLRNHGFEHNVLVYPNGGNSKEVQDNARKFYQCGVDIDDALLNSPPVLTYDLKRVYIDQGLTYVKQKIDDAAANGKWMILGTHVERGNFTSADLTEIIRYVKSKGIEIVSVKRGLELYGNVIDVPDFRMGSDGTTRGSLGKLVEIEGSSNAVTSSTPITSYPYDRTSRRFIRSSEGTTFPESSYGILYTHRFTTDDFTLQEYHLGNKDVTYRRRWDNTNKTWFPWVRDTPEIVKFTRSIDVGSIPAGGPKSINISDGSFVVGSSNVLINFPDNISGGVVCMPVISSNGVCGLRFINILTSAANIGVINISFTVIKS